MTIEYEQPKSANPTDVVDITRLVGLKEIAALAGVSSQAVANWMKRYPDFPEPLAKLRMGPIFDVAPVAAWLATRRAR